MENEEIGGNIIDFKQIALFLLKKAWIIIVSTVFFAVAGFVYSKYFVTPIYTSNAMLYVINVQTSGGYSTGDLSSYASLAGDYTKIMKSPAVLESVAEKNDLPLSPEQLGAKINISADPDSRLLRVSVSDSDPAFAKELCDMFCNEVKISIEELMNEDQITIINYGSLPKSPSYPMVGRNTVFYMLIGVIMSIGVLTVVFILKDTINSAADAERRIGIKVIGQVPNSTKLYEKRHTNFE